MKKNLKAIALITLIAALILCAIPCAALAEETETDASLKESPKFYQEESAIKWAQDNGLDDFQVIKSNSGTLNVGSTIFSDRNEAQDYLNNLLVKTVAENGGTATVSNGFVVTEGKEVSLTVAEQHSNAYSAHPIAAKMPVLETGYTEYVPASKKTEMLQTVADTVGVDAKQVKQSTYMEDGVSYTRYSYTKNDQHFIAEYVRSSETTDGETRVVYRPTQVLSKTGSVYTDPAKDQVVGYAVYDVSYLPGYQTVGK